MRYRDRSGQRRFESTGCTDWQGANRKLRERLTDRDQNVLDIVRKGEQLLFHEWADFFLQNYSQPPLREGSYRALASTANNFARESFMDELAAAAGADPLEFRLANLENPRLRAVLETAAKEFEWAGKSAAAREPNRGIGLACGTEKGSFVAACVEIEIDPDKKEIAVRHVCEAFECGKVLNPENLRNQVEGAITMGLGPALQEAMEFDADGTIQNATFRKYRVPHFSDVPTIDVQLVDRPDLVPAGAGETPIICIAPAIANAVFHATGQRIRQMPIRIT